MSQDLRLYSLSLLIVLMLWTTPVRADYGADSGCPALAVPISLNDGDVWHTDEDSENGWADYRDLHPLSGTSVSASGGVPGDNEFQDCSLSVGSGSYYDGANHLWVLDDNLTCDFLYSGEEGDFRSGTEY
jgi:hypothetical protein